MEHPSEAMIQAFLDEEGEENEAVIRAHLSVCSRCRSAARERSRRLTVLTGALSHLDVPPPSDPARAAVLGSRSTPGSWAPVVRRNLPRAASLALLLTAGAAAGFPGSPVRSWLGREWAVISGSGGDASASTGAKVEPGPPEAASPASERVGATISAVGDRIDLEVSGLRPEASLTVLLVDGEEASIFAAKGTRFRSQAGELGAMDPPGDVTLEIPTGAAEVRLIVNGQTYLERNGETLKIPGPVESRSRTEIRFSPSGGGPNPPTSGG